MTFGRWCFYISASPEGSSVSRYDTLKQVEKSTGKTPKDLLNTPELSVYHENTLEVYNALTTHTWQELKAYMDVTGNQLEWWEAESVMALAKHKDEVPTWPLK